MYQMKWFIDVEQSPLSTAYFCFYRLGLCSVSYTAYEYSIYHFSIMIEDFYISFSRVIIVQDFETVPFHVLFVYKPTFSIIFCWMKRLRVLSQFSSLFTLYISTVKSFSLVRECTEVKINKHKIW